MQLIDHEFFFNIVISYFFQDYLFNFNVIHSENIPGHWVLHCAVPGNIHTLSMEGHWKLHGSECLPAGWGGEGGCNPDTLGDMDIFWNNTIDTSCIWDRGLDTSLFI